MADLDDFFAKKDRKKKTTKKYATPEELVKQIEETVANQKADAKADAMAAAAQRKEAAAEAVAVTSETTDDVEEVRIVLFFYFHLLGTIFVLQFFLFFLRFLKTHLAVQEPVVEDEWREFKEERKDYSGLKIGQMQIKDDYSDYSDDNGEENEGGDVSKGRKTGPWNKGSAKKETEQQPPQQPKPEPVQPEKSKLYISPALRNQANQPLLRPINLRKGAAPDLANEEYFPTLGSVRPEDIKKKKNEPAFEEVKNGGRYQRSSDLPTNAPVAVGNRYGALDS